MNAKVIRDKRCADDKQYDALYNKMVRDANLTPRQRMIVKTYNEKLLRDTIDEVETAVSYAYCIALIESERFGHNKTATRLNRVQRYVRDVLNEAYGHNCFDANGRLGYDKSGLGWLINRLRNNGVEVEV